MNIQGCRVIVTGGAGFIGSHLVDRLLNDNNKVIVIDDFSTGSKANLEHVLRNPNLVIEQADVLDEQKMLQITQGAQYVFHLATQNVRLSLKQPTHVHHVNTTGTLNMLKAATAARVKRFLYCSSSEVLGTATTVPMPEEYHYHPETIYGASKLTGEYYTEVFQRSGWLNTVIARPFNSYGPREHYQGFKGEVIPRFILMGLCGVPPVIYGDGAQTRDFTFVTETAEALAKLMSSDSTFGKTFNVCKGEEVSIKAIATMIMELTDLRQSPIYLNKRPSDVLRLYGTASHLKDALGWSPQVSIYEGLQATVEWFKKNVPVTPELKTSFDPRNWERLEAESWLPQ
jgi:UDP-glucose 4-epimerase